MQRFFTFLTFCLLSFSLMAEEVTVGYSNGSIERTKVFHLGNTTSQGQAIRLSHEKLQALKGCSINAINIAFGSRMTKDNKAYAFISTSLEENPIQSLEVTIEKALKLYTYTLETPYVITGEEPELFIGYEAETMAASYNLLSSDFNTELENCSFALNNGTWTDVYGMGTGAANIQVVLDHDPVFSDVMMIGQKYSGYYKSGDAYSFSMNLMNFGTKAVDSFDILLTLGEQTERFSYSNVALGQCQTINIELPEYVASAEGETELKVSVENINAQNSDSDPSDNTLQTSIFFYPSDMERNILVEGFTGQACSACPGGHSSLVKFLSTRQTPCVEVSHHSGYMPDVFTMEEDVNYLYFYDGSSTYAPAVMFNRTAAPLVSSAPVMDITESKMQNTFDYVENNEPYVSIRLSSTYDSATRLCTVTADFLPHRELPNGEAVINVMLVQDSITAYQTNGGANYIHRHVFRGCLTGNAWGLAAKFTPGETTTWEHEFTLPEEIRSTYWTEENLAGSQYENAQSMLSHNVVPDNMMLVAYISENNLSSNTGNRVYNCQAVRLGESYTQNGFQTSIQSPITDDTEDFKVHVRDGRISVSGTGISALRIHDAQGRRYAIDHRLQAGMYIVSATINGKTISRKVKI